MSEEEKRNARRIVQEWDRAIHQQAPREVLSEIGNALRNLANRSARSD